MIKKKYIVIPLLFLLSVSAFAVDIKTDYLEENKKVVVIEDLISTGGSSLKAVNALRSAGADVLGNIYEWKRVDTNSPTSKWGLNPESMEINPVSG